MVFTVERISGTLNQAGRSDIELHGTLDMHGVQRPMDLVAIARAAGDNVTYDPRQGIHAWRYWR